MANRKIPVTNGTPDNPDKTTDAKSTAFTEIRSDATEPIPAKPPVKRRAPAKPRVVTSLAKTPAAKVPATRRRTVLVTSDLEVPTKDDVKEITAINDEKLDKAIIESGDKPKKVKKMKDEEKDKKKKKTKAKKEKAKKKAQKRKEKKKAKAKKKDKKKGKNKKKK